MKNKKNQSKVLLNSFSFNDHTLGFRPHNQKLEIFVARFDPGAERVRLTKIGYRPLAPFTFSGFPTYRAFKPFVSVVFVPSHDGFKYVFFHLDMQAIALNYLAQLLGGNEHELVLS